MTKKAQVIIVGAGPVGLSAAVFLVRNGVSVLVLEKRDALGTASKASTFHPPTLEMLAEFGIIQPMLDQGRIADRIQYRATDGRVLAEFDHALLGDATPYPFRLHLEQHVVSRLLLEELKKSPLATLRFGAEAVTVGSDDTAAWVDTFDTARGAERFEADYVIGSDGAHSAVREGLGIGMTGTDYPGKVLRLVVTDRMEEYLPDLGQISYVFDTDGSSLSFLQMPDCWRVIIRLGADFDPDQVVKPEWYMPVVHRYVPDAPERLTLRTLDIYGARKMLADSNCAGRVFIIGDALHLTNTRGGMNMNCGIHDAYELGHGILAALTAGDPAPAQAAARHRWQVAKDELLPRTDRNVTGSDNWLDHVTATAADPATARQMLLRTTMLDMAPPRDGATTKAKASA
ncbi:FAD-dependent oxidoreductase [Chachezhania sediminis]|uniref:FAD-dependent oxidoreductase n=1 Tax=Chachezhania sediminis TaxID=2599291 RepID=UPI00131E8F7F|nr:NAD(P)/FAD-dependent oxidoreductase [Chachezhania sediminis]